MTTGTERPLRPLRPRPVPEAALLDGIDPIIARLYAARGVRESREVDYRLNRLAPVGSLQGLEAATDLLIACRDKRIIVVGDFDADGATSTALVLRCLRDFGFRDVDYLVPNRFEFGYGLTPELVAVAAERAPALLVTVDNGVSSIEGVAAARRQGIEVLVTDHHLPGAELPDASAMVNPNLADSRFVSRNLAGVGVAFYLMAALGRRLASGGQRGAARVPARYLDLVALGTIADVVRLDHNNRILVQQGIERIRAGLTVAGIEALLEVSGRPPGRVVSSDLGFAVGPRLNAAGRLEDMSIGIECLLCDDAALAAQLAARLDEINRTRREIEATMRRQAFEFIDAFEPHDLPACVALYDERWHPGIVGLIASKVRERCHRPVIAFAREAGGALKGSARSVAGVHIRDLLEGVATAHPALIRTFGGHAMAAGLTIREADFSAFGSAVAAQMAARYPDVDSSGAIVTDGALPADALSLDFAQRLRAAGPWGAGFPEPVFQGDFQVADRRTLGERHLKLRVLVPGTAHSLDAIAFNQSCPGLRDRIRLAFRLDVNEYRGIESPQLIVEQITAL